MGSQSPMRQLPTLAVLSPSNANGQRRQDQVHVGGSGPAALLRAILSIPVVRDVLFCLCKLTSLEMKR
jgi:hypothetical protein